MLADIEASIFHPFAEGLPPQSTSLGSCEQAQSEGIRIKSSEFTINDRMLESYLRI